MINETNWGIPNHSKLFYNPETNQLNKSYDYGENSLLESKGFVNLGYQKVAEAFTSVNPKERVMLWNSFNKRTYSFDFSMLNSKVRHKLKRLGLYQLVERPLSNGEELLKKIKNK